jgi:hypothetical protein
VAQRCSGPNPDADAYGNSDGQPKSDSDAGTAWPDHNKEACPQLERWTVIHDGISVSGDKYSDIQLYPGG